MMAFMRILAAICIVAACVQGRPAGNSILDRLFVGVSNDEEFTGKSLQVLFRDRKVYAMLGSDY